MKPDKNRIVVEQWWVGLGLLLFWAVVIMFTFFACSAKGGQLRLAWDAPTGQVTQWRVFRGLDECAIVTTNSATIEVPSDTPSTISVRAENEVGISQPATILVIPIEVQESDNLKDWRHVRVIYREFEQRKFFRIKIITP